MPSRAAQATVEIEQPARKAAAKPTADKKKKPKQQPPYHVVLWNDDDHSYYYVVRMLQKLFGHPAEKGYELAKEVDAKGKAVVMTTTKELAELKRDQILAFGKDTMINECAGSMSATIEAAI